MADSLSRGRYALSFEVGTKSTDADRLNSVADEIILGNTAFPAVGASLADGTSANKANKFWAKILTIAAGGHVDLVLTDGSLTNGRGQPVAFSAIKRQFVRVRSPATGGKRVAMGGAAQTWAGWLTGTAVNEVVYDVLLKVADADGIAVNAGDTLRLTNPTGSSVQVDVVLVGY